MESYYTEARRQGVMFFRYTPDEPPTAESAEDGVSITFKDHVLGRSLCISADLLILSAGMVAEDTEGPMADLWRGLHIGCGEGATQVRTSRARLTRCASMTGRCGPESDASGGG